MSKTNYTKGPWLTTDPQSASVYALGPNGQNSFFLHVQSSGDDKISREECEANAQLISAAPALLEALKDMVSRFRSEGDKFVKAAHVLEQARAAITQAEGR